MTESKVKRRSTKMRVREKESAVKSAMGAKEVTRSRKMASGELGGGSLEKPGESIIDAARRRWLSAESLVGPSPKTAGRSRRNIGVNPSR